MEGVKISELNPANELTGDEVIVVVQSNEEGKLQTTRSTINDVISKSQERKTWIGNFRNAPPQQQSTALAFNRSAVRSQLTLGASSPVLQSMELLVPANDVDEITIELYTEYNGIININGNLSGVFFLPIGCDDLDRTGIVQYGSGVTIASVTPGLTVLKFDAGVLTKPIFGASFRQAASNTIPFVINSAVIKQGGQAIAKTRFDLTGSSDTWLPSETTARNIKFGAEFAQRITLNNSVSYLLSSGLITLSPRGGSSYLSDTYSLTFFSNSVTPLLGGFIKEIAVMAGDYRGGNITRAFYVSQTRPVRIYSVGGYANIYLGQYLSTTTWTEEQTSPRHVYSAPYDWTTNPDPAIRAGTKQPFVGIEQPRNATRSMASDRLTGVTSKAAVLSGDYKYWYDYANKRVYWSYSATIAPLSIYVAEADAGLYHIAPVDCSIAGIRFYGSKVNGIYAKISAYTPSNNGGPFLGVYDCEIHGGYAGAGVATENIDCEVVNTFCYSVAGDSFNNHFAGTMNVINGGAYHSGDDGASPHEDCIMYVSNTDLHYSYAGNMTVAFGAVGYGYGISSISADILSPKVYSRTLSVISGQESGAVAYYADCYTDARGVAPADYYAQSQQPGKIAALHIARRRRASELVTPVVAGNDTTVSIQ